ncbi:MAG: DUF935 family protein [Dehalococcoidales bacterium]|nr:DUF935 family protein [Dehalococcoidales bacterium]
MRLKIGNFEILAERTRKPELDELGAPGTSVFAGVVAEEYNTDLQGQKGITIYEKMRKSDARVKLAILVCEMPLRAATWTIEPASDEEQDKQIAEFIEANLLSGMTITWDSFLHHALLMLPFGFSMFEKVWEIRDNRVAYRKLAPRLPKTLGKWLLDENGGLAGIEQHTWKNDQYKLITIPVDKLLVFTNEKEGSNFEGVSILRTAYKHWYYKDNLYRIDGIAAERHATGVPVFKHPSTAQKTDKDRLDEMGQHLQAHEQQYIRLAEDYDFDIKGVTGAVREIMPSINHHDRKIAESVLADFLDLGGGERGSWALSKDKSSFFLMSLGAVGKNITDTINEYVIKPLVDYNFQVKAYPKLQVSGLETRDMEVYARTVTSLLGSGGITSDLSTENHLRSILELPQKEEKDYEKPVRSNPSPFQATEGGLKKKRELTPAEKYVAFAEIEKKLDDTEQEFVNATKEVMGRQIDNLVDEAAKIIENRQINKVNSIEPRYKSQMESKIYAVLKDLLQYGKNQVKQEIRAQKSEKLADQAGVIPDDIELIEEYLRARSKATANTMANKLKVFTTFEALRQIKTGVLDKPAIKKGLLELSDRELVATAKLSTSEAFNFGRGVAAATMADDIDRVQYSAILDGNQCSECEKMDGQEWPYNDPRTDYYSSGNPDCEGGGRCRCVLIYIAGSESRAVK